MNTHQAMDDLKAIREIMARTRRESSGGGGWFMILWGMVWVVGFSGSQFLLPQQAGWLWLCLNVPGIIITGVLLYRMGKRSHVKSPVSRLIVFWWLTLIIFDVALVFLFNLKTDRDIMLLAVLSIAMGYVQFGLFSHWLITVIGVIMAAVALGTTWLAPNYFYLMMGMVGGGVLVGSGAWMVRQGE